MFYQISFAIDTLNRWARPVDAGKPQKNAKTTLIMQVVLSLVLLGVGCYLLINGDQAAQKTGYSLIGIVTGYWLR
jgi:hypothetical protein